MKKKILVLLIVILFIFPLLSLSANTNDDWPMFRHDPQHTGYSECEMPDQLELLWKYKMGGPVSEYVVANNKVYIGCYNIPMICCLDAETGEEIWKRNMYGLALSCSIADDKLYIGSHDDHIYCLDANTGGLIWKYKTGGQVVSSTSIVKSKVYVGSNDSYIYCLGAETGELIWKYKTGGWVNSSPSIAGDKLYIGSNDSYIYCLDAETGELIWKYETDGDIKSSPTVTEGKVYIGSYDTTLYSLNANTGGLIWKYKTGYAIYCSPAMAYGKVYVGSGDNYFYCLNGNTGNLIWKYKTRDNVSSSPAIADGKVYIGSSDKHIYCLNALKKGELIWKYKTSSGIHASPVVANGKLYVGSSDNYIYCFGSKKETPTPTTPPPSPETIFIGCPLSEEWPTPPYECLKDLWWQDSNENGVLDLSESREEVYIDEDSEKFEYRTVIEEESKGITWYGGVENEKQYFVITYPATIRFLSEFYNLIHYNEENRYFVCGTPHWSWNEDTGEDVIYFEVGETINFCGWEITLKDINIYENKVKWLIKSPEDKKSIEYSVVLTRPSVKGYNAIGIKERIGEQKFTIFALDTIKTYVGAGGNNKAAAAIYALTNIELIDDGLNLSEKDIETLTDIAKEIESYNLEIPTSLDSEYTITIEKKDIEFNSDGEEEYVISFVSEKIKPILPTPTPTTTPPPTTTPAPTTPAPTTKPKPTTSPPPTTTPTTSPSTTTLPPTTPPPTPAQPPNYLLYLGFFVAVIVSALAVYQITKKKPEKIKEELVEKEKLFPEQIEQIKSQIEEKKKYIENYRKIMKQDPSKKAMAEKLIRQYEEEIEELEREVGK